MLSQTKDEQRKGPRRRHVEISGAGIVGLTAAMVMAQRGWSVRVHERNPELREVGAGLTLWDNGMHVLRELGVLDALTVGEGSANVKRWTLIDERDRTLQTAAVDATTFLRLHMHRILAEHAEAMGVEILTSSVVKGATPEGELLLEDGTRLEADLIIAADGVHSAVREYLAIAERITNLGDGCVRFIVDRKPGEMDDLFIEHWSGSRRIGILPCTEDIVYIYGCCAAKDTNARTSVDTWAQAFPAYRYLLDRITKVPAYNTFHEVRLQRWSVGRVAIVGDAANAMSANLGLAANLGIVNAYSLAQAADGHRDNIEAGLHKWEASERPFTDSAQSYARHYTRIVCDWPDSLLTARSALVWAMGQSHAVQQRVRVHPAVRRIPHIAPAAGGASVAA
jgi:2-polyprenyl-6-methoxyphenol hydroxylase-like FAD-dependent oxidoreductase